MHTFEEKAKEYMALFDSIDNEDAGRSTLMFDDYIVGGRRNKVCMARFVK